MEQIVRADAGGACGSLAADASVLRSALDEGDAAHAQARALFAGPAVLVADIELAEVDAPAARLADLPGLRLVSAGTAPPLSEFGGAPLRQAYQLAILRRHGVTRLVTLQPETYPVAYGGIAIEPLPADPRRPIPYGRHALDASDIAAVTRALRSPWLTGGPEVERFEAEFAAYVEAPHAVAVANGTAALHAALAALGIGPGDEVIVPPLTFVATANAVLYQGATPVFADVDPQTLTLDPRAAEAAITPRTRAILTVDYAGQSSDYAALRAVADRHGIALVGDACHALGARHAGAPVGTQADIHLFSLHPVKHITAGEGGVATTRDAELAARMRRFRNHCMSSDFRTREGAGQWGYDVTALGWNYRLTDFQCALARSQLTKADAWLARRRRIAAAYDHALRALPELRPPGRTDGGHAWHLYVVRSARRDALVAALRARGVMANVHYRPVHTLTLYRDRFGVLSLPVAERAGAEVLSLPIFGTMSDGELARVIEALSGGAGDVD